MTSQQIRNQRLRQQLGFDYDSMPALPTLAQFIHPFTIDEEKPPPTYPAHFAPAIRKVHVPAIPDDFDIRSLTFEGYKALNLNFAQEHEFIGRIRDELPLIDRDEVDHMILVDAARILENGVFSLCRMMQIDSKAVKNMLEVQFKKFYGPEANKEVTAAPASLVAIREDAAETTDKNNTQVQNDANQGANIVEERSRTNNEATPPVEPARKRIKHTEPETMRAEVESLGLEIETDAGYVLAPPIMSRENTVSVGDDIAIVSGSVTEPAKKKLEHTGPETIQHEAETEVVEIQKENTYKVATPTMSRKSSMNARDDVSFGIESVRHPSIINQRSQTTAPTPGTSKKAKRPPQTAAQKAISTYKGVRTRKGKISCIATLKSRAVAEEWETLEKKPKKSSD